jgi:hypothetical protein
VLTALREKKRQWGHPIPGRGHFRDPHSATAGVFFISEIELTRMFMRLPRLFAAIPSKTQKTHGNFFPLDLWRKTGTLPGSVVKDF